MDNEATLSGIIASEPIFSHCIHETRLYTCEICVKRLSNTVDRIVLLAPEALCSNLTGEVTVHGQLRGYTRQDADKRRLILMVLVRKVMPGLAAENNRISPGCRFLVVRWIMGSTPRFFQSRLSTFHWMTS